VSNPVEQEFLLGGYSLRGLVRRVRRSSGLSQRELATHAGVAPSLIAAIENGSKLPGLRTLQRIFNTAGSGLAVLDGDDRLVVPLMIWGGVRDGAGRRYPAHLDTIVDPEGGEWWATRFGLAKPPETFRRARVVRDYERRLSQWQVRVAKHRFAPCPELRNRDRYPYENSTTLHDT
jgi:transcriptional regulator with XRE-family HTH domain